MNAVHGQQMVSAQPDTVQEGDGRLAALGKIAHFCVHFTGVQGQKRVILLGQGLALFKNLRCHRGGAVRRDQGMHPCISGPGLQQLLGAPERLLRCVAARRLLTDDGLAGEGAQAHVHEGADYLILIIVHVRTRGDAGEQHLRRGKARAEEGQLLRPGFLLQREQEPGQPVRAVIAHGPERHHARVTVGVHKPGDQKPAAAVDHFIRVPGHIAGPQRRDASLIHQEPAAALIRNVRVHGKQMRVLQQYAHAVSPFMRSSTEAQKTLTLRPMTFSSMSKDTVCCALGMGVMTRM